MCRLYIQPGTAAILRQISWYAVSCPDAEDKLIGVIDIENEIVGEALIALRHEELKEMAIISVGHRLTILKGVYDVKVKQDIPIDSDHWIPPCELIHF